MTDYLQTGTLVFLFSSLPNFQQNYTIWFLGSQDGAKPSSLIVCSLMTHHANLSVAVLHNHDPMLIMNLRAGGKACMLGENRDLILNPDPPSQNLLSKILFLTSESTIIIFSHNTIVLPSQSYSRGYFELSLMQMWL